MKSNARMPAASQKNIAKFLRKVENSPHRSKAVALGQRVGGAVPFFKLLHSIRRWYSGQTMAHVLLDNRKHLATVMDLRPQSAVGLYRGFKLPTGLISEGTSVGDCGTLAIERNRGFSSWTTTEAAANRFSGAGKGKTGVVVRLVSSRGITPVLAPPSHTEPWFNEFYSEVIGKSFRPTEGEYLIYGEKVKVEVARLKR